MFYFHDAKSNNEKICIYLNLYTTTTKQLYIRKKIKWKLYFYI